jgi:apolipoprotein N-acyltransferase
MRHARGGAAFLYAFLAGLGYYWLSFHWVSAFHRFALPFVSIVSAALFFAAPLALAHVLGARRRCRAAITASIWVAFEFVKQGWFLQFPFGILGYSQYSWNRYIQIAELGGVALVSWLIVFVNASAFRAIEVLSSAAPRAKRLALAAIQLAAICAAILLPLFYGSLALSGLVYDPRPRLKIGFAQTLVHPRKAGSTAADKGAASIARLSGELRGLGVDLALFPELSVERTLSYEQGPALQDNARILNGISAAAKASGMNLLFGSLELRDRGYGKRTYNTMQMFSGSGDMVGIYRKMMLVPFGETNPFEALFPGLGDYLRQTTGAARLDRGDGPHVFGIEAKEGGRLRFGVLICYESCFGSFPRYYASEGADFLVCATNDLWSLSSVAMYQHAIMSVFRAIETRTPVLRISNGGFSCYVDERGRYSSSIPVFSEGLMTSRLFLLRGKPTTLYVLLGDWVAYASISASLATAGLSCFASLRERKKPRADA